MVIELHRGNPSYRDYRPTSDVAAGSAIEIGSLMYIAHRDIKANELGALAAPSGKAAYRVPLKAGETFADGAAVSINASGEADSAGTKFLGYAEGAAAAGAEYVVVRHDLKGA